MSGFEFIPPGSTLGILGGGQLGRMFAMAAHNMGYQVAVLDPDPNSPAGMICEHHIQADYDDESALDQLVSLCQAVSTEFENVPSKVMEYLQQRVVVHPAPNCVAIAQNRIKEKNYFRSIDVQTADFIAIQNKESLEGATDFAFPAILKTAEFGYDGKGQIVCHGYEDVEEGYKKLGCDCVLENRVDLEREVSVILSRTVEGQIEFFPVAENEHVNGILDRTLVPAGIDTSLENRVLKQARMVADGLEYVGVLAIEFFITRTGDVLVNEMAPRPHNSGHYTMNACYTSQFEQQVRAVTHGSLGDGRAFCHTVMINVLGDSWRDGEPKWQEILATPGCYIHLYGKKEPRAGRKMGHINIVAESSASLSEKEQIVRKVLLKV